jgi:hypothetical protein
MYEELATKLTEAIDTDYARIIPVELTIDGLEFEDYELETTEVGVEYEFQQEHRKEGIKDIIFVLQTDVEILFEVKGQSQNIIIDANTFRIDWLTGQYYTPSGISIYLDSDLKVREAAIDVFFISK